MPIPEGVERDEEEPKEDILSDDTTKNMGFMSGSGGSASDEERKKSRTWKGKERDIDVKRDLILENTEVNGCILTNRHSSTTNSSSPTVRTSDLMAERERQKGKRKARDKDQESVEVKKWDKGVETELPQFTSREFSFKKKPNEIGLGLEAPGHSTEKQVVEGSDGQSLHH